MKKVNTWFRYSVNLSWFSTIKGSEFCVGINLCDVQLITEGVRKIEEVVKTLCFIVLCFLVRETRRGFNVSESALFVFTLCYHIIIS